MEADGPAERRLLADVREVGTELVDALLASTLPPRRSCWPARRGAGPRPARTSTSSPPRATPKALAKALAEHHLIAEIGQPRQPTACAARTHNGIAVDLRIVPPDEFGNLLQHFTGSKEHNVKLRERAVKMGLSVSEHGIADAESGDVDEVRGRRPRSTSASASPTSSPSCGRARGEIALAEDGELPELVSSTTSAATSTATRRSPTARTRSTRWPRRRGRAATPTWRSPTTPPRTASATTSSPTPLRAPDRGGRASYERAARRRASGCSPGSEVNILPDGSLDYEDELLGRARLGRRQRPHLVPDQRRRR